MTKLKRRAREQNLERVRVQKSGCLNYCEQGASCVVYPQGVWYSVKNEEDLEKIWKHLTKGEIDESILMKID